MQYEYYLKIEPATIKGVIEILACLLMLVGLVVVIWHRLKTERGLTSIALQFLSIIFVFPTVLILSMEGVMKGESAATLIGALAGYLFSEFGRSRPTSTQSSNGSSRDDFQASRPPT